MEKERRGSEGGYEESGPLWKMIESLGFLEKEGPSPQLDQLPKLKAKAQVCGQALFFCVVYAFCTSYSCLGIENWGAMAENGTKAYNIGAYVVFPRQC